MHREAKIKTAVEFQRWEGRQRTWHSATKIRLEPRWGASNALPELSFDGLLFEEILKDVNIQKTIWKLNLIWVVACRMECRVAWGKRYYRNLVGSLKTSSSWEVTRDWLQKKNKELTDSRATEEKAKRTWGLAGYKGFKFSRLGEYLGGYLQWWRPESQREMIWGNKLWGQDEAGWIWAKTKTFKWTYPSGS